MGNRVSTRSQSVRGAAGRIPLGSCGCTPEEARDGVSNVDDVVIGEGVGEHGVPSAGRFPVGHAPKSTRRATDLGDFAEQMRGSETVPRKTWGSRRKLRTS
jgi:hypothetical protein